MSVNIPQDSPIRSLYSDEGANWPNFGDDQVCPEKMSNPKTGDYFFNIYSFDGSLPTAHSTVANSALVPIGSRWHAHDLAGSAVNKTYEKTGASTWTKISAV